MVAMSIFELFILAVGLSMDAFAVSICKGISIGRPKWSSSALVGLWFGAFQAIMPITGFYLGVSFRSYIEAVDHWVAFILLAIIGIQMLRESFSKKDEKTSPSLSFGTMIILSLATSIDALASGIAISAAQGDIVAGALFIGCITFTLSTLGVRMGSGLGKEFGSKAEAAGGIILILIGLKILIEHLSKAM